MKIFILTCGMLITCPIFSGEAPAKVKTPVFATSLAARLASDYLTKEPSHAIHAGLSLDDARQIQKAYLSVLSRSFGPLIGYKVGLTSKAAQEMNGSSSPVRGALLTKMMLEDGAVVSAKFGTRPLYEPDLIVIVKDEGISQARNTLEVAEHLSELVAFIELPDRTVAADEKVNGNLLTAINAGARLGVLGQRIKIDPTPAFVQALETMTVTATDQNGKELARAPGSALLGHPLNAVLWLIKDLAATGEHLKAGQLLSLGSFSRPEPPQAGQEITVRYQGLPSGTLKVSVRFTD